MPGGQEEPGLDLSGSGEGRGEGEGLGGPGEFAAAHSFKVTVSQIVTIPYIYRTVQGFTHYFGRCQGFVNLHFELHSTVNPRKSNSVCCPRI